MVKAIHFILKIMLLPVIVALTLNWNPKFLFAKLTSDSAYLLQD